MILENNFKPERQNWMSVLAKADLPSLEKLWIGIQSNYQSYVLRKPETGLVMVRGRMGGSGAAFNTGEATVTRCSVKNERGDIGHGYVLGRSHRHAQLAAEIDVALQDEAHQATLVKEVISPLNALYQNKRALERKKTATTKVDFFTVVRGED